MAIASRFGDLVSLNTATGTVYMPAIEAQRLARDISKAAISVLSEKYTDSNCTGRDRADYDADTERQLGQGRDLADKLAKGLVRVTEPTPHHWRAFYRLDKAKAWRPVINGNRLAIDYTTPNAAYNAACYSVDRNAL